MVWIKIVTYAELTWLLENYSLMNFKTAFKNKNKMFQWRKYKVKSFSLRVMDFWNLYGKTSNHIWRVKFWHLQSIRKFDTYKDQHSHSPSHDWQTQPGHFIPPLIELKVESSVSEFQIWTWVYLSKAHSHLSSDQCVWVDIVPDDGSSLLSLYKNTITEIQNDPLIVLSKVFTEHHYLPCML